MLQYCIADSLRSILIPQNLQSCFKKTDCPSNSHRCVALITVWYCIVFIVSIVLYCIVEGNSWLLSCYCDLLWNCTFQTAHFKLHSSNCAFQTAQFKLSISNCPFQTAHFKLHSSNCTFQTAPPLIFKFYYNSRVSFLLKTSAAVVTSRQDPAWPGHPRSF
jgi:hypothetical protein